MSRAMVTAILGLSFLSSSLSSTLYSCFSRSSGDMAFRRSIASSMKPNTFLLTTETKILHLWPTSQMGCLSRRRLTAAWSGGSSI